ncbi:MAG: hypothetical protein EBV03_08960 [Proteobacteria bacterium]|nr:hypothetical protein [Pseudomonadota bacterium]
MYCVGKSLRRRSAGAGCARKQGRRAGGHEPGHRARRRRRHPHLPCKNRSATLADLLVTSLEDSVKLLPDPHRFAGFAVLKAPDVPSVLIELGFLSHPQEEKLINSRAYRDKVVAGIAHGIDSYFQKEKTLWTR